MFSIGVGRLHFGRRRPKSPGGGTYQAREARGPERAATNSRAANDWEFKAKLLDTQTLADAYTAESVLHDTLAMLTSRQRVKRRCCWRQKSLLTITPTCIYVHGGKSKSATIVHDVGNVMLFEVAKENQTVFGYTAFNSSTGNVQLLCFQTARNAKMNGLDVQAAYFAAYSMWAEALPLEERQVEERQTVITVEIHGEERAEEEEEEEWFDARDELAFQSDSQEPGDEEEEEEWFDARDVFEGEITEAVSTAGGLTQTLVQRELEPSTEIQEAPKESGQNTLLVRVWMKITRKKSPKSSPGITSKKRGSGTSLLRKLCRRSSTGEGSASLEDELVETDGDESIFPDSTEGLTSNTSQDVPLQCHESDGVHPNTDSTEANGSLTSVDLVLESDSVQEDIHECQSSEECVGEPVSQRPSRSVHWGSVSILHLAHGRAPWRLEYCLPDVPRARSHQEAEDGPVSTLGPRNQPPQETRV